MMANVLANIHLILFHLINTVHPNCYVCNIGLVCLYITTYYNVYAKCQAVIIMK
jgi:hypothetical protein